MASPNVKPGDPNLNEQIMYAKCIKGHALRDANDWILCENLPAPDARCWLEGGETLFSLRRKRAQENGKQEVVSKTPSQSTTS